MKGFILGVVVSCVLLFVSVGAGLTVLPSDFEIKHPEVGVLIQRMEHRIEMLELSETDTRRELEHLRFLIDHAESMRKR